jgi:hypothetical protein|nr:MAG TPA: hypothetical protein [Caudoviricetes sp.]
MSTSITVSKTIQVKQFEPLTVTITRTLDDSSDTLENRKKLYSTVGAQVKKVLDLETRRYGEK